MLAAALRRVPERLKASRAQVLKPRALDASPAAVGFHSLVALACVFSHEEHYQKSVRDGKAGRADDADAGRGDCAKDAENARSLMPRALKRRLAAPSFVSIWPSGP